jgi:hypothetical protein
MNDKRRILSLERIERESKAVDELVEGLEKPEGAEQTSGQKGFWTRQFPASGKGWG